MDAAGLSHVCGAENEAARYYCRKRWLIQNDLYSIMSYTTQNLKQTVK